MKRAEFYSGAGLCILALLTVFLLIPWQIDEAAPGYVSPRLVPQLSMLVVAGLAALQAFHGWRGRQSNGLSGISRAEALALSRITTILAVALGLFLWVAPLVAAIVLIAGLMVALGERRLWIIAVMTATPITLVWLVFYHLLGTAIL